eukprot:GHRR01018954.1.p1 GENE.GHRR01018954.1~~GHRR01018954.1.p1  ORF type:complete len:193 (+),score=54.96 GHRR01018954.1:1089-1667(+)
MRWLLQATSYVSRRRLDASDFDPNAVDEEGLPLVYNEARIAAFWSKRPGELASRWTRFAAIIGEQQQQQQLRRLLDVLLNDWLRTLLTFIAAQRSAGVLRQLVALKESAAAEHSLPLKQYMLHVAISVSILSTLMNLPFVTSFNPYYRIGAVPAAPWLTKLANAFFTGQLEARQAELARNAVDNLERLGPTL